MIKGPQVQKLIREILSAITTCGQHNGIVIDMCDQELERMSKKLVRGRRTAVIEEKQKNLKYVFQIEQLIKIKNTEVK